MLVGGVWKGKRDRYKSNGGIEVRVNCCCGGWWLYRAGWGLPGLCHGILIGMTSDIARDAEPRGPEAVAARRIDRRETDGTRACGLNWGGGRPETGSVLREVGSRAPPKVKSGHNTSRFLILARRYINRRGFRADIPRGSWSLRRRETTSHLPAQGIAPGVIFRSSRREPTHWCSLDPLYLTGAASVSTLE